MSVETQERDVRTSATPAANTSAMAGVGTTTEGSGTIRLEGRQPNQTEIDLARATIETIRQLLPRFDDEGDVVRGFFDIGELYAYPIGNAEEALIAMREAFRRRPGSLAICRGYRKAATRLGSLTDIAAALDAEAAVAPTQEARAALRNAKAELLETRLQDAAAARSSYGAALEAQPGDVVALSALERLSAADGDRSAAADWARRLADAVTDPSLRAEHLARSARYYESIGQLAEAQERARTARASAARAPSVVFLLERLAASTGNFAELAQIREQAISEGEFPASLGWFDLGIIARYRLGNRELAARAFAEAAKHTTGASRTSALAELATVLEEREDWTAFVGVQAERVEIETSTRERASLWFQIGVAQSQFLKDDASAATSFENALAQDPSYSPALEAAGRLYQRLGSRDKLLRMHRLEADAAATPMERGAALRRAGDMLAGEEATIDDGIALLREAVSLLPGNLSAFASLERALRKHESWIDLLALYDSELARTQVDGRRAWLLNQIGALAADRLGDARRAIDAFRRASELDGGRIPYARIRLSQLLEDQEDFAGLALVLDHLAQDVEDPTQAASILERLAGVHERRGEPDAAVEVYRRAVERAPASHPVHASAGRAFQRAGAFEELAYLYDAAARNAEGPARARWLIRAAEVYDRDLRRREEAALRLREALVLTPESEEARAELVQLLTAEQRWREVRRVLDAGPDQPHLLVRRAALAEVEGDVDIAATLYAQAVEAGVHAARGSQARALAASGRFRELVDLYSTLEVDGVGLGHAQYRAAEIAGELVGDFDAAITAADRARVALPDSLSPVLLIARLPTSAGSTRVLDAITILEARVDDKATRYVCALARARATAAGSDAAANGENDAETISAQNRDAGRGIAILSSLLALQPGDPVISVEVELGLEKLQDRIGLIEVLRRAPAETKLVPELLSTRLTASASTLEEVGQLREAADALEAAVAAESTRFSRARFMMPRVYRALDDEAEYLNALRALGAALPPSPERALTMRHVAKAIASRKGSAEEVIGALEDALQAYPTDYEALRELNSALIKVGQRERIIDALMRAFNAETNHPAFAQVGAALGVALVDANRMDAARNTAERVLGVVPDDQRALMILADVQERTEQWVDAASTLTLVSATLAPDSAVRFEALCRLARIQGAKLADMERARTTVTRLSALPTMDPVALSMRLELELLVGDHRAAVSTLENLVEMPEIENSVRVLHQIRLAQLREQELNDVPGAIAVLSRVTAQDQREFTINELMRLGEASGRWDLAASALESALDRGPSVNRDWERSVRVRLADLCDGPLARPESARRHYERIVEIDPRDVRALERLSELSAGADPARAMAYHRQLIALDPTRIAAYRALRKLSLLAGDNDTAFRVEALLVGLGIAEEEEAYFYKQRKAALPRGISGELHRDELAAIFPEMESPAIALLGALAPATARVFPVDFAGYGIDPVERSPEGAMGQIIEESARLLGRRNVLWTFVASKLGPCAETSERSLVLIPRSLDEAMPREQRFVAAALMTRVATGTSICDPRRANPATTRDIEMLLGAACDITVPEYTRTGGGSVVYEDVKKRLEAAIQATGVAENVRKAATRLVQEPGGIQGAAVQRTVWRASARAALLASQDPSVAIPAFRTYASMFQDEGAERAAYELPESALAVLGFVLSAEHGAILRRLGAQIS